MASPDVGKPRRIPLTDSAQRSRRKLQHACVFSLLFMVAEVVGGLLAGSLAIVADAAHLFSDVAGFGIALFAVHLSTHPATDRLSFGFQRAEVIGAVSSVLVTWALTVVLVYEAIVRLVDCLQPQPKEFVDGMAMFIVACLGLVVNVVLMQILGHGHSHGGGGHGHSHGDKNAVHVQAKAHRHSHGDGGHDHGKENNHGHSHGSHDDIEDGLSEMKKELESLNVKAAYIHALGDFIQSIGVCIAGALIWWKPHWQIADPIATLVFAVLVVATTVGVVRDSVHVLMEGTPMGVNSAEIEKGLRGCASVVAVHDLHVWSLSAGLIALSVHLVSDDNDTALDTAQAYLRSKNITHTTIQVERTSMNHGQDCASNQKCGQVK